MKKGLIIVIAVAILGGGGLIAKSHKSKMDSTVTSGSSRNTTAVKSDTTTQSSQAATAASPSPSSSSSSSDYKDGTYTGAAEDTAYGTVQVAAVISGGKITDIKFVQMPGPEDNSKQVTAMAEPGLKSSTLAKQSAHIDFVSGATQTSEGYEQSLQSALDKAV